MSKRRIQNLNSKEFIFTKENLEIIQKEIKKYPKDKQASAVIVALSVAQKQASGWLPKVAMDCVADILNMPYIKVYEVATFYTMFNLSPVGKYLIQICRTTPCWLRESEKCLHACMSKLQIKPGENTANNKFTLMEVECLGACVNAPVMQINDIYFQNLTPKKIIEIINQLNDKNNIHEIEK